MWGITVVSHSHNNLEGGDVFPFQEVLHLPWQILSFKWRQPQSCCHRSCTPGICQRQKWVHWELNGNSLSWQEQMQPHLLLVFTGERHHTNAVLLLVHHRGSDSQLLSNKPGALQAGNSSQAGVSFGKLSAARIPLLFQTDLLQVLSFQAKRSEGGFISWLVLVAAATSSLRNTPKVVTSATYSPSVAVNEAQSYQWRVLSFSHQEIQCEMRFTYPFLFYCWWKTGFTACSYTSKWHVLVTGITVSKKESDAHVLFRWKQNPTKPLCRESG